MIINTIEAVRETYKKGNSIIKHLNNIASDIERKTQTVRLNFIKISLNLSVFYIYWLVFTQTHYECSESE
ncbi:hypothetical protein SUT007_02250 [Streptococcus parasuis]|nr:hypothetical protein SUT007_02250 [Streptococcus parasuis]